MFAVLSSSRFKLCVENVDALESLSLATLAKRLAAVRGVVDNVNDERVKTLGEKSVEDEESFVPMYTPPASPRRNDNNDDDDNDSPARTPDTQPSPSTTQTVFKKPTFFNHKTSLKRSRDDDESSLEEGEYCEGSEEGEVDFDDDEEDDDEDYVSKKEIRKQLRKKAKTENVVVAKEKHKASASASDDDEIEIIAINGVKVKK